jgi:hypothetical protein
MAAQPTYPQQIQPTVVSAPQQKVTFVCGRFPNLKMVLSTGEQRFVWMEGKQTVLTEPDQWLDFKNGVFETSDPKIIEFIRGHSNFTGVSKTGGPDRQIIKELAPVDPNQIKAMRYLQQMGAAQIVQAVEKTHGIQPGYQVQDPVMATVQAQQQQQGVYPQAQYPQQQGYPQNAYQHQVPRQ